MSRTEGGERFPPRITVTRESSVYTVNREGSEDRCDHLDNSYGDSASRNSRDDPGNGYRLDDSIYEVVEKGLQWQQCHAKLAEAMTISMPIGVIASTHSQDWEPREKDLKCYFHFDRLLGKKTAIRIANDPDSVAKHSFFPLIRFHESWTKFRKDAKPKKKIRPLRYAAHIDAAIYARYRSLLSPLYENELSKRGIPNVPVAYRRILQQDGKAKSNIEIAREVFERVRQIGDCIVTVVDIKSYFESLDHHIIKENWELLLGYPLPPDHLAVYKSVTKYSVVDYDKLISRLELLEKPRVGSRKTRRRRKIDQLRVDRLKQICSPADFRKLVAGGEAGKPSLIQKNGFPFGIPQGTPISDLIANFYLLDFDSEINDWAAARGGIYRRYSDDIVVVLPVSQVETQYECKSHLQARIGDYGPKLRIQDKKVCIVEFSRNGEEMDFTNVFGTSSRNGLEYLGFEFDGKVVKIKNSTLSNAWRKMKRQAYGYAFQYVKRYSLKGEGWIRSNYPYRHLETKILRDVTYNQDTGYETWTFVKYARRASRAFVGFKPIFSKQTKLYRYYTKTMISEALDRAIKSVL